MTYNKQFSRNKYNAKSTEYNGAVYHLKMEAGYAEELDWRLKAKEITKWERQVRIPLDVNGKHICNYYIDFKVYYPDDTTEYVEVKGFETEVWRLKWKLFEALYGENETIKLTIVK